jgi:cephalosporin-C deacetylase
MVKRLHKLLPLFFGSILLAALNTVCLGQTTPKDTTTNPSDGQILTDLISANKDAIFSDKAKFTFRVKNKTHEEQVGSVKYQVTTETGKELHTDSVKVKIAVNATEDYTFVIPESTPGFYKLNFMIYVTDTQDTTRRAFGIRPDEIKSSHKKPGDFDAFWQTAKDELAKVKPNFKVTPMPKLDTKKSKVYLVEMQSLDTMIIRAWMTIPITNNKNKKFAVLLDLPGYQVDLDPITGDDPDVVLITLNVRGQGNSRGPIDTRHDEFIVHHIEDKNQYVMRGVVMDCLRAMDFIWSRPDFDHNRIFVKGGSMGAYLALATASLDKRVNLCSAQSPILCDIRNLQDEVEFPWRSINTYLKTQPGLTMERILDNLDYFDGKNFAPNVTCNTIMSIGLVDNYAPPNNEYAVYNSLNVNKHIMIFKDLAHDASPLYVKFEDAWMHDEFALY